MNETPLTAMTLLVVANTGLTLTAGYFIKEFVREVRELQKEFQRFQLSTHGRLSALEGDRTENDRGFA